ncbi:response regulator [Pseudovibrio exalbescens]|nr:response regulator [Pseudovibrio exalbescens]MDD7908871.1 response regulator [Pseudovibrio exalbescens]
MDVAIVEDSRAAQTILRSLMNTMKVKRFRIFDSPKEAVPQMFADPPNLILSDWHMQPVSGYQMLCLLRNPKMAPLTHVPLIFVTAHGTRGLISKAMRAGAHHVLAKPLSAAGLQQTLEWVTRDARKIIESDDGGLIVEGVRELLDQGEEKYAALLRAEEMNKTANKEMVDRKAKLAAHEFASLILHPDFEADKDRDAQRDEPRTQKERSSRAFGEGRRPKDPGSGA